MCRKCRGRLKPTKYDKMRALSELRETPAFPKVFWRRVPETSVSGTAHGDHPAPENTRSRRSFRATCSDASSGAFCIGARIECMHTSSSVSLSKCGQKLRLSSSMRRRACAMEMSSDAPCSASSVIWARCSKCGSKMEGCACVCGDQRLTSLRAPASHRMSLGHDGGKSGLFGPVASGQ